MIEAGLEILPVFTRWRVLCKKCNTVFYVDTVANSTGNEITRIEDIHCGLHPSESSVISLA